MIKYTNERIEAEKDERRPMTNAPITKKNGDKMWKICKSLEAGDWIWVLGEGFDLPVKFIGLHENGNSVYISHGHYEWQSYIYYYQVLRKITDKDREEIQEDVEETFGGYLKDTKLEMT